MDRTDSFMNWGFKPQQSVDEIYYSIYKYWNDEGNTSYQSPAVFKPFDEDPLKFLENQIVEMCGEILQIWEGYFVGNLENCEEIISGEEQFPIDVYYRGGRITTPFISVDFNPDNPDDIYNALYGEYLRKFAKEIMKSITKDNLQNWLKERREFIKNKPWYRNTTTILTLTDLIGDEYTTITLTVFNKKF
tara:strand:+ start:16492 stop:17061 length:570 start_codon:yes stop_codon:yes gene_type:complete